MESIDNSMDLRKSPRAALRMPVRLRWQGSFGMRLEITETLDVSREGMLIVRSDPHGVSSRVWVTFPFERSSAAAVQPETPATVIRVQQEKAGSYRVALKLELPKRDVPPPANVERRRAPRVPFALPIFVRPKNTPWPEESMTRDISKGGALIDTSHLYHVGDSVLAKIPWGEWSNIGEIPGQIVRVETRRESYGGSLDQGGDISMGSNLRAVAVEWRPESASTAVVHEEPAEPSLPRVPRFKLL
jgi:PilZ domain